MRSNAAFEREYAGQTKLHTFEAPRQCNRGVRGERIIQPYTFAKNYLHDGHCSKVGGEEDEEEQEEENAVHIHLR